MKGPILFKDKQVKILLLLKNTQQPWHITTLAAASGTTYVHTHNFLKACATLGIASIDKHGKLKEVRLTEKGSQIADALNIISVALSQAPKQEKKEEEKKQPQAKAEEKKEEKK
jgi:predicted transcriptional regulator